MIPSAFYVVILIFVGIFLFVFAYSLFTTVGKKTVSGKKKVRRGFVGDAGVCPVCETILAKGEQIKSALYPGESDRICHIFGCPHCHPYPEDSIKRTCPVCKKPVPQEGYLIARFFERPNNKRHVHILGCTVCRVPNRKK
jgi:endogenous inhibitor of DNA gyrase (YacG/DUF329 family)